MGFCLTTIEMKKLLAGDLPEGAAGRAREHIEECARCKGEYASLERRAAAAAGPETEDPDESTARAGKGAATKNGKKKSKKKSGGSKAGTGSSKDAANEPMEKGSATPEKQSKKESSSREITAAESTGEFPKSISAQSRPISDTAAFRIPGYRWLASIPEGGVAFTSTALDERMDKEVRIRVGPAGGLKDPGERMRFEDRVQALRALRHPGVASPLQGGVVADRGYLVTEPFPETLPEWAEGVSAAERVQRYLPAMRALAEAHCRGIHHKALGPRSFFDREDGLHLAPFPVPGLASDPEAPSVYMAPEGWIGGPMALDARGDVYALAAVLCHAVTGHAPISEEGDREARIQRITEEGPRRPASLAEGLDPDLDAVLARALSPDPHGRYEGVGALLADLERWRAGLAVEARAGDAWYCLKKAFLRVFSRG